MTTTTQNQIKFTVKNLKEFDADLNRVANQVAKTQANPVINGIHLQAKDHALVLTATDGTNTLKVARSEILESSEPVSIVVPKLFAEIVRKLPNTNEMELSLDGLKLEITSGKSHFTLCVLDGSEFPPYTHQALDHHFRVNGQAFASALKKVVYSVATSETRPILTAVQLMGKGNTLQFIATDSHRLSFTSIPIDESVEAFQNVLLTGTSVMEMIKLCEGIEGDVEVEFSEQQLRVTGETTTFSTRLLNGTYPDVQKIIPKEFKTEFTINREEWMKALERASVMKEKDKGVLVKLSVSNGTMPTLTLETQHPQIGKMTEELFIETTGEACVHVNAKFLHDALKHMETKDVQVRLNGKFDPFVIMPSLSSPSLALVLPIRVN